MLFKNLEKVMVTMMVVVVVSTVVVTMSIKIKIFDDDGEDNDDDDNHVMVATTTTTTTILYERRLKRTNVNSDLVSVLDQSQTTVPAARTCRHEKGRKIKGNYIPSLKHRVKANSL